ncbi:MAG: T9SS type A sorting domain-containing protein, partial [Saprospiraceae bacterium]|nr:T9SS type A sorting domain-containing protein [Saprospiraceae bacterium]
LNNYIYNDPDLNFVRVQYRRTGGDGAWINIDSLSKADLESSPVFKLVNWDMSDLADGPYEIRAITQCYDVGLPPGISEVIKGRLETKPPVLFGEPQPADGVLSPDDEISITFTKRVDCTEVFQADGIGTNINLNNIALLDMTDGGILVDAIIACKDEKIIITPNISNQYIENHVLRAVATDIKDLYGNPADQVIWEFYVNRSNLFWHELDIDEVVVVGNELMVTREIRNQSGEQTSYSINDIPDWMDVFPTSGSLAPGAIQVVKFIFPSDLVAGSYSTSINLNTVDGNEPLKVDLRVACPGPEWVLNPADYSFSMNLTLQLNIEGTLSSDRLDKIGAFVDGKLRGIGKVQYHRDLDKYLAFLTVYSNEAVGETITFQIWDASSCLLYGSTIETFPFVADDLIGSPLVPQIIYTDNQILRKIYLHPGWNWISYNINLTNASTNNALSSLTNPAGGLIKSQTEFSVYSELLTSWLGDLETLSHLTMYQYNSLTYDSLALLGAPVDPSTEIPTVAGWNWIGYLPQYGLPVTQALSSLTPLNGDIVKGQVSFAQYVAGVGWIGNLNFMSSPNGYLLKLSNPGILSYPAEESPVVGDMSENTGKFSAIYPEVKYTYLDIIHDEAKPDNHWNVSPQDFEYSMNTIAVVVKSPEGNILKDGDEVGVFVGAEVRGSSKAIYIPVLDAYMIFLTIYADMEGELLKFKLYDASDNKVYELAESTGFRINGIWGQADDPIQLHLEEVSGIDDDLNLRNNLVVYPNPAGYYVYINYTAVVNDNVNIVITDIFGKVVKEMNIKAEQDQNVIEWKPEALVPNGIYLITLRSDLGVYTRKVELLR